MMFNVCRNYCVLPILQRLYLYLFLNEKKNHQNMLFVKGCRVHTHMHAYTRHQIKNYNKEHSLGERARIFHITTDKVKIVIAA